MRILKFCLIQASRFGFLALRQHRTWQGYPVRVHYRLVVLT
jgi:hypothetical protein